MRYRLRDWDVPMPAALQLYWTAWNATDVGDVPGLLIRAVTIDVEWNDPRDSFRGIEEVEAAIVRLRTGKPEYRFSITSEVDHHHGRFRYRWNMARSDRILMEGEDIVTTHPASGLIRRVDGFFGQPSPIRGEGSGVPRSLHP